MFSQFNEGDTVKVWPTPGLRVHAHPDAPDRFLDPDGQDVTWSPWMYDLARQGALCFTDPREGTATVYKDDGKDVEHKSGGHRKGGNAMHPHEWVAAHRKPAMHLSDDELKKLGRDVHWHLVEGSKDARAKHLAAEAAKKAPMKEAAADGIKKTPIAMVGGKGALTVPVTPTTPAAEVLSTNEAPSSKKEGV